MSEAGTIGNGLEPHIKRHSDGHPPVARKRVDVSNSSERFFDELKKNTVLTRKLDAAKNRILLLEANLRKALRRCERLGNAATLRLTLETNPEVHPSREETIKEILRLVDDNADDPDGNSKS